MSQPMTARVTVHLHSDRGAPSIARRSIATTCAASGIDQDCCETAALLVSELVSNAVLHAGTDIDMQIVPEAHRLRVEVTDQRPNDTVAPIAAELDAPSGRGLKIVDALATRWGVEHTDGSKTVWFELPT